MSALDNKAVVRRWMEALNNGTWRETADAVFTTAFVGHDPNVPPRQLGPQGVKDYVYDPWFAAFPNFHATVEDLIAEGDKVVVRATSRATHQGEFMGIPPTGKVVTYTGIAIFRIEEGKIAEVWQNFDALGLMQQLGAIPQMAQGRA